MGRRDRTISRRHRQHLSVCLPVNLPSSVYLCLYHSLCSRQLQLQSNHVPTCLCRWPSCAARCSRWAAETWPPPSNTDTTCPHLAPGGIPPCSPCRLPRRRSTEQPKLLCTRPYPSGWLAGYLLASRPSNMLVYLRDGYSSGHLPSSCSVCWSWVGHDLLCTLVEYAYTCLLWRVSAWIIMVNVSDNYGLFDAVSC